MNRDRCKELLPIIQAFADGKEIERFSKADGKWVPCPRPQWRNLEYRIKPEPKEIWVNEYRNPVEFDVFEDEQRAKLSGVSASASRIAVKYREMTDE